MIDCVNLYNIIRAADKLSKTKGWVFLLYYPIMKEIDSMRRHIRLHSSKQYCMRLIDDFYFDFRLYNSSLPTIDLNEFCSLLNKIDTFIPSPLKSYSVKPANLNVGSILTNYHDASPCFFIKDKSFRVKVNFVDNLIGLNEQRQIIDYILEETFQEGLYDMHFRHTFKTILTKYVGKAANAFPVIWSWLEPIVDSNIKTVVTDQTLAPAQCCVNHILKAHGVTLITLQHQTNILFTDIFSLLYLDFLLSDIYYTWFSKDFLEKNYGVYLPLCKAKVICAGNIEFSQTNHMEIVRQLENSKTCLFILNAVEEKFIAGTMNSYYNYTDNLMKVIGQLRGYGYNIFIRKDPRSDLQFNDIEIDNSCTIEEAIRKYDFCICDRPGWAAIKVMKEKGYVFICFDTSEFKEIPAYSEFRRRGNILKEAISKSIGILDCSIDLLCA